MCDMDEWLCITEQELVNEEKNNVSIIRVKGLNMIGESNNIKLTDINLQNITKYVDAPNQNKNLCFYRPLIREMNYGLGAHSISPLGDIKYSNKTYYNKHMNYLGEKYYIDKILKRYIRVKDQHKYNSNLGCHYINDIDKIKTIYNDILNNSKLLT